MKKSVDSKKIKRQITKKKIERDQILRKKFLVKMKLTKRPSRASHHLQNNESVALQATRKHIQIDITRSKLKFFRNSKNSISENQTKNTTTSIESVLYFPRKK